MVNCTQTPQAQQRLLQQQILMSRGGAGMGVGVMTEMSPMPGGSQGVTENVKRSEKSLRELLEEQDIGESVSPLLSFLPWPFCSACMHPRVCVYVRVY